MKLIYTLLFFCLLCSTVNAQIKYVTPFGAGTGDGNSWLNAFSAQQFADTSYAIAPGTQVWIAAGTYHPTKKSNGVTPPLGEEYNLTFVLNRGVKFYGGFIGTESSINDRNISLLHAQDETILSGDFGIIGQNGDNAFTVLSALQCGAGEVLDGITVANSLWEAVSIRFAVSATATTIINNCVIKDNSPQGTGNAINMRSNSIPGASVDIFNSYFTNNFSSLGFPGAIAVTGCRSRIMNCVFYSNLSQDQPPSPAGNCIHFYGTGGEVSNCTFYKNAPFNANGLVIVSSNATDSIYLNNSIFWKNYYDNTISNIAVESGNNLFSVKNCIFQTQNPINAGPVVIINSPGIDPLFVNEADPDGADNFWGTADDGLNLSPLSPCIDNGKNEWVLNPVNTDILSNVRVKGCRVDIGAYEYTNAVINTNGLYSGIGQSCTSFPVSPGNTIYADSASCHEMTTILPAGANPVSGNVQVCVTNNASVPFINGVPYVPRHYDIVPVNNAANATARITVYFTQQDFNSYNIAAPGFPQLPTSPSDAAGIANILIEQDHGISLTGVPGTYNGTTVYINPADNDIIWNSVNGVWEVSFEVTGFSGFFMTTVFIVPVDLTDFSGKENNHDVDLYWTTTSEINLDYFDVLRSSDGRNFISIGRQHASGNVNGDSYSIKDKDPLEGINYYKLVSVDVGGSKKYSDIISVNAGKKDKTDFVLTPNPVHTEAAIDISGILKGKTYIIIYGLDGRKVKEIYFGTLNANTFSAKFNVAGLNKGVYIISVYTNNEFIRKKLVVQ